MKNPCLSIDEQKGGDGREHEDNEKQPLLRLGQVPAPHLLGAAAALFLEMKFPVLHAEFVEN
jgi:hypothetical protein